MIYLLLFIFLAFDSLKEKLLELYLDILIYLTLELFPEIKNIKIKYQPKSYYQAFNDIRLIKIY